MSILSLALWREEDGFDDRPWYMAPEGPPRFVRGAAHLTAVLALVILGGWIFGLEWMQSLVRGAPRVVPLTALAFLISSAALLAGVRLAARPEGPGRGRDRVVYVGGALAMLAIGAARMVCDLYALTPAIDLGPLFWLGAGALGEARMAQATAFNLVLLAIALLMPRGRRLGQVIFQTFVLLALLISGVSLGHFVYGGEPLTALAQMSIPTTTLFLLTGTAMLFLRPDEGLVRLLRAPTEGGTVVRYLLIPVMLIPPTLGWVRLNGELAGLWSRGAGVALFALINVSIFGLLVWSAALWLDRADNRRKNAEGRTRKQVERLQLLHQITRATSERQDAASIFQVAVRSIEDHLPADFACVCLHDRAARTLQVVAIGTQSRQLAETLSLPEHATFGVDPNGLERCMSGLLVYEDDISRIDMPFPRRLAAGGLGALVLAPLSTGDRTFGLMVVARREKRSFGSGECEFLRQLCDNIALAYSQADLNTALQAAYVDLQQSQQTVLQQERLRALGEMASGIAHDINNAISPAAIHSEILLERERALSPEARARLETVQRAIADVAQTVARMQVLYRQRAPNQDQVAVRLNPLVEQVLDLTRSRWRDMPLERGIVVDVVTSLGVDLPLVRGIESEIREALTNLVFNAVDAMPEGGLLTISTRLRRGGASGGLDGSQVLLEVADTGTGMDEETRRRCFEPFYTTKGDGGSGLGLPMVFSVAQRHDAEVEVDSELGRGSVVRLVFPVAGIELSESADSEPPVRSDGLHILVIDDDPILLETLCDALSVDGHTIVAANGGAAGIETFRRSKELPFDLVFTDLGMPQVDGRRVAAAIKEGSPATPVVLLTGWGQRMVDEDQIPPHVDMILSKPPRIKALRQAISRLRPGVPAS